MSELSLVYVALVARDVQAVCRFLGETLALEQTDLPVGETVVPFFGVGVAAIGVFGTDDAYLDAPAAPGVHHMALSVSAADAGGPPSAGRPAPGVSSVEVAGQAPRLWATGRGLAVQADGSGPAGCAYVAIDPKATCGIRTRLVEPFAVPAPAGAIRRIDHLGIASNDIGACRRVFVDQLGCPLESTETDIEVRTVTESFVSDKYGAVFQARPPEIQGGLHCIFVTVGDCDLEIMADYVPDMKPLADLGRSAGNTRGDQSAIAKFVARRGPGIAHVAFETPDIDALLARVADDGWELIDPVGRPGGRGSRIAFVHPSSFGGGLLLHFVERRKR